MSQRGVYGKTYTGADVYYVQRGSSLSTWLIGGLLVGGAALWAKHQSDQVKKLYATSELPYEGFIRSLGTRTKGFTQRFGGRSAAVLSDEDVARMAERREKLRGVLAARAAGAEAQKEYEDVP